MNHHVKPIDPVSQGRSAAPSRAWSVSYAVRAADFALANAPPIPPLPPVMSTFLPSTLKLGKRIMISSLKGQ
jgi:hypothetical protein